jgi:hypothetical protein
MPLNNGVNIVVFPPDWRGGGWLFTFIGCIGCVGCVVVDIILK